MRHDFAVALESHAAVRLRASQARARGSEAGKVMGRDLIFFVRLPCGSIEGQGDYRQAGEDPSLQYTQNLFENIGSCCLLAYVTG